MWLGERLGNLADRSIQRWVRATGRRVDLGEHPWLAGPVGSSHRIGADFFDRWAAAEGLRVDRASPGRGLLPSFAALAGGGFDPAAVHTAVGEFYERTADFALDVWPEWGGLVRPFAAVAATVFSRRLGQFNLPLSPLDVSWGVTSEILRLTDPATGRVREYAWVRTLVKSGQPVYVGSYSVVTPPAAGGPCVKAAYPLPSGNAVVVLRPHARPDGGLELAADGRRFGAPGLYLVVHTAGGVRVRFVRTFRKLIRVYPAGDGVVRADHTMSLVGLRCLHHHYRFCRRGR